MKYRYFLISLFIIVLLTQPGFSQLYMTPRSVSYADAYSTVARGADVIGWNPANLGLPDNPHFMLNFGILPLAPIPTVQISNSALSPFMYNRHFLTGGRLDDSQKEELLGFFPDDGLNVNPLIQLRFLDMSFGSWALSVGSEVTGTVTVPKSLFHFVFFGNEFGEPIDLSDTGLELQSVLTVALAHGREISIPALSELVQRLSAGAAVKTLWGIGYTEFNRVEGSITTYKDRAVLEGDMQARYGAGGFGVAIDLGMAAQINERMFANVSLHNLLGRIHWGIVDAKQVEYLVFTEIESADFGMADSLLEAGIETDTTYHISGLKSNYPAYLLLGFQYELLPEIALFGNIKQFFSNDLAATYLPKVSVGARLNYIPWMPIRVGLAVGGIEEFQWGIGSGLDFKNYTLDWGFTQIGGMFNHARGFAFSMGQSLRF